MATPTNTLAHFSRFELSVRQNKYQFEGLFVSLPRAVTVDLYMFLSVTVCEFPLLQRLPVAPETLTDTRQVFPLRRHILSICWSPAKKIHTNIFCSDKERKVIVDLLLFCELLE